MRVSILCPGPSLARTWTAASHADELVIAVNRAPVFSPAHVWVAADPERIRETRSAVRCYTLVTAASTASTLRDRGEGWTRETVEFESLFGFFDPVAHVLDWPLFSMTAAIVYAASRGATDITLYGADWKGEADFDGALAGGNRSVDRWQLERGLVHRLIDVFNRRGITIKRVA